MGPAGTWLSRPRKWMAVYTWSHTTWGVHSTQRAQAVHSALAGRQLKNLSALSVIDEMNAYNEQYYSWSSHPWSSPLLRNQVWGGRRFTMIIINEELEGFDTDDEDELSLAHSPSGARARISGTTRTSGFLNARPPRCADAL